MAYGEGTYGEAEYGGGSLAPVVTAGTLHGAGHLVTATGSIPGHFLTAGTLHAAGHLVAPTVTVERLVIAGSLHGAGHLIGATARINLIAVAGTLHAEGHPGTARAWKSVITPALIAAHVAAHPDTPTQPLWSVVGCERNGPELGIISKPQLAPYTDPRIDTGDFSFTVDIFDEGAIAHLALADLKQREVKLYRNTTLAWMGVVDDGDLPFTDHSFTYKCKGLWDHYEQMVFGPGRRHDLLTNGGFENDLASWVVQDTAATISTLDTAEGAKAVFLDGIGNISQTVNPPVITYSKGLAHRVAFRIKVPQAVRDISADNVVVARLTGDYPGNPGDPYLEDFTLGDIDIFGEWAYGSFDILLSANVHWSVRVEGFGNPDGIIGFDHFQFFKNDAVTVEEPGQDLAVLMANIFGHARDPNAGQFDLGFELNMPDVSIITTRAFAYADHEPIGPAVRQLCQEYGIDLWINFRERTIYGRPKRGTSRPELDLAVVAADAESLRFPSSGGIGVRPGLMRSQIIAIGEGATFAREEAGAVDTTFTGGALSTKVVHAEAGASFKDLQPLADTTLLREKQMPTQPRLSRQHVDGDLDLIGVVEPGDTFTVSIDAGLAQIPEQTYRIEKVTVDPNLDLVTFDVDADIAAAPRWRGGQVGDTANEVRELRREVEILKRKHPYVPKVINDWEIVFKPPSPLVVGPSDGAYEFKVTTRLSQEVAVLTEARSGDTSVDLFLDRLNGEGAQPIGSVTVPSGQTRGQEVLQITAPHGSILTKTVTEVGAGGGGLTSTTQGAIQKR